TAMPGHIATSKSIASRPELIKVITRFLVRRCRARRARRQGGLATGERCSVNSSMLRKPRFWNLGYAD
ncbi:MAG: hypothetical protein Q8R98_04445, partial [Rubrivivax sp.]|nr:hypothetical protein [Rubrivivax sp.]